MIRALIAAGGCVADVSPSGESALMLACKWNTIDVLDALLGSGADVSMRNQDGVSALHIASQREVGDYVRLLLAHMADPNATDSAQITPLICAAQKSSLEAAILLLRAGANQNVVSLTGETALLAVLDAKAAVPAVGRDGDITVNSEERLIEQISMAYLRLHRRTENIAYAFLGAGAAVNVCDTTGETVLIKAIETMDAEFVRVILALGADPHAKTSAGVTAEDIANSLSEDDRKKILELLAIRK